MAEYITVIELEKKLDLDKSKFIYYSPFVYCRRLTYYDYDSYFTELFGASSTANEVKRNIINITINNTEYTEKTSVADCQGDEESFYFDILNQVIYIHLNHLYNILDFEIWGGNVFGCTNLDMRYYNDLPYKPVIKQIPSLDIGIIPGQYSRIPFFGGSITFDNLPNDFIQKAGLWDDSYSGEMIGNIVRILFGLTTYTYAQLLGYAKFNIGTHKVGLAEAKISITDQRKKLSKNIPDEYFSIDDYPDIEETYIGKEIPLAFGIKYGVPGICIDGNTTGAKTFKVPGIDVLFDVWVEQPNGTWERKTPTAIDDTEGLITLSEADSYEGGDDANQLLKVKVDGVFIVPANETNAADIIRYINDEYLDIPFDTSGYDTVEWNAESLYLDDVGIYVDKKTEIYELIEKLQNSCEFGFFYQHNYDQRTIRVENQNRTAVRAIEAVEILDLENSEFEIDEDDFYSHAIIRYKENANDGSSLSFENNDYYDSVINEYDGKENEADITLGVIHEKPAENRSIILLDDWQRSKFTISFTLAGIENFSLRPLDIVNVDFTVYYMFCGRDITIPHPNDREFLGVQRCMIINTNPDLANGQITLTVRQSIYSDAVESIINNKSFFFDLMQYYSDTYMLKYWLSYVGTGEITTEISGDEKSIKIGNNSGDDSRWLIYNKNIPFDETALYEVRAIVKKTAGTGLCYIGVAGIASDGITFITTTGAGLATGTHHYFALSGVDIGSDWTEYKGYFQGKAAVGNGGQHNDSFDPGTVHEDAEYIRPILLVNQAAAAGETYVKEFQIKKVEA